MNAPAMTDSPQVVGYRTAIMALRDLAALIEQHPEIDYPNVTFNGGRTSEWTNAITFHVWEVMDSAYYAIPYNERAGREDELLRAGIIKRINTIVEAFPSVEEWVPNDPSASDATSSYDRDYYKLTGTWGDLTIFIIAKRRTLGEDVEVVYAGPQVTLANGKVHALRQTMTIWKPAEGLSPRIMDPATMLESASAGPAIHEIEAVEVEDDPF